MPNQIDERIKKERVSKLMEVSDELEINYLEKFIGREVEVLIEKTVDGLSIGHTGNYLQVEIDRVWEKNTLVNVLVRERDNKILKGTTHK